MANRGKDSAAKKQPKADVTSTNECPANNTPEEASVKDGGTPQKTLWSGGSWKGKSAAVAKIAKESISIAATKASETVQSRLPSDTSPKRLSDRLRTPSKSSATTKLSISQTDQEAPTEKPLQADATEAKSGVGLDGNPETDDKELGQADDKTAVSQGWRSWLVGRGEKNEKQGSTEVRVLNSETGRGDVNTQETIKPPKDAVTASTEPDKKDQGAVSRPYSDAQKLGRPSTETSTNEEQTQRPHSTWFGLWGSSSTSTGNASMAAVNHKGPIAKPEASNIASDGYSILDESPKPAVDASSTQDHAAQQPQSSWAFWSRETPKSDKASQKENETKPDVGELAVENTTSEANPKPAQLSEAQQQESSAKPNSKKRDRPVSTQTIDEPGDGKKPRSSQQHTDSDDQKSVDQRPKSTNASGDESSQAGVEAATGDSAKSLRKKIQKLQRQNLLLPAVRDTFRKAESPSYWQQVFRIFGRGASVEKRNHLSINPHPPKLRKALAIGVHGYFPGPLFAKGKFGNHSSPLPPFTYVCSFWSTNRHQFTFCEFCSSCNSEMGRENRDRVRD